MMKSMRKKHASRMGMLERIEKEKNASYGGTSVGFLSACAKEEDEDVISKRKYDLLSKHIMADDYIKSSYYKEEKRVAKTMPCRDFEFCAKCEYFENAIEPLSLKVKKESYSCGKHSKAVVHESIHKQDWNSHRIPVDCPFRTEMKLEEWNGDDA